MAFLPSDRKLVRGLQIRLSGCQLMDLRTDGQVIKLGSRIIPSEMRPITMRIG